MESSKKEGKKQTYLFIFSGAILGLILGIHYGSIITGILSCIILTFLAIFLTKSKRK